jgi:hypothetical protein
MNAATQYSSCFHIEKPSKARFSLQAIVAALFMVSLREAIDSATAGDKSDAAFACGM